MLVPIAEWRPDAPAWSSTETSIYAITANNVIPAAEGVLPWPALVALGTALSGTARGIYAVRRANRSYDFYAGTATTLEKFNWTTRAWDDVSQSGGYTALPTDDNWGMVQFGTKLIAVQQNVSPQVIDVESGGLFADLSGSPPQARGVQVVKDVVVLFDILDNPRKIVWSDTDDETNWTPGGSSLAGSQVFSDGGNVTGVTSSDTGYVLQMECLRRMTFIPGSADIFHFEKVGGGLGVRSPYGWAEKGGLLFILAEDGFYMFGSDGAPNPIGAERVNRTFFENVDTSRLWATQLITDPVYQRLYIASPSADGASGVLDTIYCHDWVVNKWTKASVNIYALFKGATQSVTLEDLDALFASLEDVTPSLDSRYWYGGAPILGAIGTDNILGFFTGTPMEATVDTGEIVPNKNGRSFITRLRPLIDTAGGFFNVGVRKRLADAVTWKGEVQMHASGRVPVRANSWAFRFKSRIPAGTAWTHFTAIDIPDDAIIMAGGR